MLVDSDAHLDVGLDQLKPFMAMPWRRHLESSRGSSLLPQIVGDRTVGGRIRRPLPVARGAAEDPVGADVRVVFPERLFAISLHPNPVFEEAVAGAYARWLTEDFLPRTPGARGMLYLPVASPAAARRIVAEFGERRGVVGGFVTNARHPRMQDEPYVLLYEDLQERGLTLGFHPITGWAEPPFQVFDRYLAVWALGQPFGQTIQIMNWILHGMPVRFPRLRCVFYEAGVCWTWFVAHRLDQEFFRRPSEAPLLRDRPSHYMRSCYFSTQPLDQLAEPGHLALPFRTLGPSQFVYGSNHPAWDFDVPARIRELTCLTSDEKRAVLGDNARRLFDLDPVTEAVRLG